MDDKFYLGVSSYEVCKDRNKWYEKTQDLNNSLKRQDKIIDSYRNLIKELEKDREYWRQKYLKMSD